MIKELNELIQKQKKENFGDPSKATDQEALGIMISQYFQWDGQQIFDCAYNAFEDSNFHSFNEKFENMWKQTEGKWNTKVI